MVLLSAELSFWVVSLKLSRRGGLVGDGGELVRIRGDFERVREDSGHVVVNFKR